ncbi:MAG: hypothetical protein K2G83_04370, partial [Ruminococcus sp.]|nr:hypothetical protein [Ruminococcus sp.]
LNSIHICSGLPAVFRKKRTAEIESRYGITINDDIKLKRHKAIACMEGIMRTVEFKSDIDGLGFMEKTVNVNF